MAVICELVLFIVFVFGRLFLVPAAVPTFLAPTASGGNYGLGEPGYDKTRCRGLLLLENVLRP